MLQSSKSQYHRLPGSSLQLGTDMHLLGLGEALVDHVADMGPYVITSVHRFLAQASSGVQVATSG
eukprot:215303-Amphidinium_carterae.1